MEMERFWPVSERSPQVQQNKGVAPCTWEQHRSNTVAAREQRAIQVQDGRRPARILQAGHAYRSGFRGPDSTENSEEPNEQFCVVFGVGGSESPALLPGRMNKLPFPGLLRPFCALNAAHGR